MNASITDHGTYDRHHEEECDLDDHAKKRIAHTGDIKRLAAFNLERESRWCLEHLEGELEHEGQQRDSRYEDEQPADRAKPVSSRFATSF